MNSYGDLGFKTGAQPMTISNTKLPVNLDDLLRQRTVERIVSGNGEGLACEALHLVHLSAC